MYSEEQSTTRLINEAKKYNGKLIVAFDFDNTIFDYHNIGLDCHKVIELLAECSNLGMTMILFTATDDHDEIQWKIKYCNHFKIRVDYVNQDPILHTKKPYYNILLDDRAGLSQAYRTLKAAVDYIKTCLK